MQIAELMNFDMRQTNYYYNANKYLKLWEKKNINNKKIICLTEFDRNLMKLSYKQSQLKLV
nr:hypothetical protein [Mycoplasma sp. HU2014]